MENTFHIHSFNELTSLELYSLLKLRQDIFVVEQNCIFPDLDEKDLHCMHVLHKVDDKVVAYCRILPPGITSTHPSIGRICVKKSHRGTGLAENMIVYAIRVTRKMYHQSRIEIAAQQGLVPYYEKFGFETISDAYDEDGIMHVDMIV